jgi:ABC-type Na+ transport system ATPase subunit NatA
MCKKFDMSVVVEPQVRRRSEGRAEKVVWAQRCVKQCKLIRKGISRMGC